jgi:hypothetical protein
MRRAKKAENARKNATHPSIYPTRRQMAYRLAMLSQCYGMTGSALPMAAQSEKTHVIPPQNPAV